MGITRKEIVEDYEGFVNKFKPKKTTDDCYTPPIVYDAICDWACERYGIDKKDIVRPFYPGGDFENFEYQPGVVVLDNPPFSILSKILDFYIEKGIKFFLFASALTIFSSIGKRKLTAVIADADIEYENGARVKTAFITNLENYAVVTSQSLNKKIKEAIAEYRKQKNQEKGTAEIPKYEYPENVVTAAMLKDIAPYADIEIGFDDVYFIRELDDQKKNKKSIYGAGYLLSETAMKKLREVRIEAAKKKGVFVWELSEREREIIKNLG